MQLFVDYIIAKYYEIKKRFQVKKWRLEIKCKKKLHSLVYFFLTFWNQGAILIKDLICESDDKKEYTFPNISERR